MFRKIVQQPGENLPLQTLHDSKELWVDNVNQEIKAQLIQSCTSNRLCRHALREPDSRLDDLLDHGRTGELSKQQAEGMKQGAAAWVNAVHQRGHPVTSQHAKRGKWNNQCRNCGWKNTHMMETAQLKVKTAKHVVSWTILKRKTHNKVYNITNKTHSVSAWNSSSSDDAYVFPTTSDNSTTQPQTCITLNSVKISVLIDSGATADAISETTLTSLKPLPELTPANIKIFPYGCAKPLPITGAFTRKI